MLPLRVGTLLLARRRGYRVIDSTLLQFARQIRYISARQTVLRRLSYGGSAPHSGGQDNSSFFTLLGLAGVIG
jgi:hypothetical protein